MHGARGGAPPGSQNHLKHGVFAQSFISDAERAAWPDISSDAVIVLDQGIKLCLLQLARAWRAQRVAEARGADLLMCAVLVLGWNSSEIVGCLTVVATSRA